jgi:hypothetical protein
VPNPWGGLVAPSGPVAPPAAPVAVAPPVAPPCPPLASSGDVLMQPKTIQDARADRAVPGTMISAPLAPAFGPITVGVEQVVRATPGDPTSAREPMVVLTLKAFWDSPTVIKARRIIIACMGTGVLAAGTILGTAISAGKTIWTLPWGQAGTTLLTVALGALIAAVAAAITTGYFVVQKTSDNNPIQGAAATKGTP